MSGLSAAVDTRARLQQMLLIRYLELRIEALGRQGLTGDIHLSRGEEAISVGVCAALRPGDRVTCHHRAIPKYLALGGDLDKLIGEVLNRTSGCNGGQAGEMHLSDDSIGFSFSFQLVATCIPVACGIAWALKNHHKSDAVVACFFGDAATANGQFHEGMNIAAVHKLPILFVCENNHRAGNITPEHYMPAGVGIVDRGESYGIPSVECDGNDVERVHMMAERCIGYIRDSGGPLLLECHTERLCVHKFGQGDARTPEQLAKAAERDPLRGIEIPEDIKQRVDDAIERALQAPKAEPYETRIASHTEIVNG